MKHSLTLALLMSLVTSSVAPAQPPVSAAPGEPKSDAPKVEPAKSAAPPAPAPPAPTPPPSDEDAKKLEQAAKVGPNQQILGRMAGEWTLEIRDLAPNAETIDTGTMSGKMILGGRFLSMDVEAHASKKLFHGVGLWGYSNLDKRFESTWSDSLGTSITFMTGAASEDGKTLTMSGEMTEPITQKKMKAKEVTTLRGRDEFHSDFFVESAGKDTKVMEIDYKRKRQPEKSAEPKKPDEKAKGK